MRPWQALTESMPSTSWLPWSVRSWQMVDLTDFDLSIRVSVPTSSLPICFASMSYFSSRVCTAVIMIELMSSSSLTKAMFCCPSPIVNFPAATPLCVSRSDWRTAVFGKYTSAAWIPTSAGRPERPGGKGGVPEDMQIINASYIQLRSIRRKLRASPAWGTSRGRAPARHAVERRGYQISPQETPRLRNGT